MGRRGRFELENTDYEIIDVVDKLRVLSIYPGDMNEDPLTSSFKRLSITKRPAADPESLADLKAKHKKATLVFAKDFSTKLPGIYTSSAYDDLYKLTRNTK